MDSSNKWTIMGGISSPDGGQSINGTMQLYSIEHKQQQIIEGFTPSFADANIDPTYKSSIVCFIGKKSSETQSFVHINEIGVPKPGSNKLKIKKPISYSPDVAMDFPVIMQPSEKYGVIFMISKMGYLFIFEMATGETIFRNRISNDLVFCSAKNTSNDGILCINRKGQVLSVAIDEEKVIPYILNSCGHIPDNVGLAFKMAQRSNLPGADELFVKQFNQLLAQADYSGAARVAISAPGDLLRNMNTINKFRTLPQAQGQPQPLLQYFSELLNGSGKLNAIESMELVKRVLEQNRKNLIEEWIKNDKLEITDELGELINRYDPQLALSIFIRKGNPEKVVQGFVQTGQFEQIIPFCKRSNYNPDFVGIITKVCPVNPEAALNLAKLACNREGGKQPMADVNQVFQIFMGFNRIQEGTAFLLEALAGNRSEEAHLQTQLFEMNIKFAPKVAEAIFQMKMFTHYDKVKIAQLCEQQQLFARALENYTDINDIRRVILNTHVLKKEEIVEFLGSLDPQQALACLYDLLKSNRQNLQIVIDSAVAYNETIPTMDLIKLFETFGAFNGIFFFVSNILNTCEDPEVYFKFIEASVKLGNFREVERVIRETQHYDPVKVKDFLKEFRLQDPRPLIYLCDMHGFVDELTRYLYKNGQSRYIEAYLYRVNIQATPAVMGTLLDLDAEESFIRKIMGGITMCNVEELVDEFDKRNKLKFLQGWLEARASEHNEDPAIHTALAKIYVSTAKEPQKFLEANNFYDSKIVGKYCEDIDPHLSVLAYKKAKGACDQELIELTNKHYLYRIQAKYLVERQDVELWKEVLQEENPHRKQLVEQVVQSALPDTKNADEVSVTVKAFIEADLPHELIDLLDKIVLHTSEFSNIKHLQNLLIYTAIKSAKDRVMDYINRLENFDGHKLAKYALEPENNLFEEAFAIYTKINEPELAVDVLLSKIGDLERSSIFAEKINDPMVWSKLGQAQLNSDMVSEAIASYIKANDPTSFVMVIGAAEREEKYDELIQFLKMAREQMKEPMVDGELIYAYAKVGSLNDIEEFINQTNSADIGRCGDRCYDEKLWEAGKLLYSHAGNNGRLASCLVHLKQFQAALEAAKKANTPKTWKEVSCACVRAREFRLAAVAGMNILIHPDHLEDLIDQYELFGYYEELISLLENGLGGERSHIGLYTELGVLYAKYMPKRLMDHLRTYFQKVNIPKLLRACETYQMWNEAVFLYSHYDEFDNAIQTMMDHSPSAWQHDLFVQNIQKVANSDLYYRAMGFYLEENPLLLNDLLISIANKVDLTKAVSEMRKLGFLILIEQFLRTVQIQNISAVNEALNEIYIENEDHESLRTSVTEFDNFDQIMLAKKVESHELLEFRRIAALMYRKNKKYLESIRLSQKDELYKVNILVIHRMPWKQLKKARSQTQLKDS
eukprot:TRINITY_DN2754_c0_g1_i2.p1 TRINITY_DN2754_c0_g1~~TRINITY_DN2754_c0_g1_i2.p1  ORF type:complete len:1581 (-),score=427.08 TRINITY_DN2754_c0_g1_i2:505-4755(-)